MNDLRVGIVGFDITPGIHPQFGAWGTTHTMTEIDMPLLSRCIAFEQNGHKIVWYGSDLVGEMIPGTNEIRDTVAEALKLSRDQVLWSTSQTHSSGAVPGSKMTGSGTCDLSKQSPEFAKKELDRHMTAIVDAGRSALESLQPARVWAGKGFCDSMSYNTRFPMPGGGVKFSRHHTEGLQSGKFFDPTIGLVRFDSKDGKAIGAIFNFCCHPATMINDKMISPDWVGTARQHIEEEIDGAPAMFVQGFLGDVNCYHVFGNPDHAKRTGARMGQAAVHAMRTLIPARGEPLDIAYETIELPCRPMYSREELDQQISARHAFIEELEHDPAATWCCGINFPEAFPARERSMAVQMQIDGLNKVLRILENGESLPNSHTLTIGAIRIGDVAGCMCPGENFTLTGMRLRQRSPFVHTLICGDTNGIIGYIGTDDEIDRGGYETDSFWKTLREDGFRLAPAKGATDKIINTGVKLLNKLI